MPFIEERERVSRIIGERCRSGPRNVPESNLGRSDPQQTSEQLTFKNLAHRVVVRSLEEACPAAAEL